MLKLTKFVCIDWIYHTESIIVVVVVQISVDHSPSNDASIGKILHQEIFISRYFYFLGFLLYVVFRAFSINMHATLKYFFWDFVSYFLIFDWFLKLNLKNVLYILIFCNQNLVSNDHKKWVNKMLSDILNFFCQGI